MSRREYCQKHNIPVTTFDYWRHVRKSKPRLVEVAVETQTMAGFALVLAARGFERGDVVAIASDLSPRALVVALAAQGLGGASLWILKFLFFNVLFTRPHPAADAVSAPGERVP